jgi:hypothetical protein
MSAHRVPNFTHRSSLSLQLARIVAVLQQQRQQQGVGGGSKLSPSDLGGGGPKLPMTDSLPHPGMGGSVDLHQKTQGYSGERCK